MWTPEALREKPAKEALLVWGGVLAALALAKVTIGLVPYGGSIVGALAVALFLWAPSEAHRRLGRPDEDYGLSTRRWQRDALFAVVVMAIVFPLFAAGFRGFLWLLDHHVPREVARHLVPYGTSTHFEWRAPKELLDKVAGNIAVAIGEEFFYRGYVMDRLLVAYPPRARLLGVPFGKAAWLQTALFAAGHLLSPQAFRLGTFFPGLMFTWMAVRSGGVLAGAIVHAASNLLIATLEASAFGP
jgi:membrane protease YdiL (CAAX protease family)